VVHFEIGGHDAVRTRAFYSELFDWDVQERKMAFNLRNRSFLKELDTREATASRAMPR
jgi:predicted enzyme related to lactoylglutathione lyase